MCGISGIISRQIVNPDAIKAMTAVQTHRGPDGNGEWISPDGKIALGHRRLSIIDLSERAGQPMSDITGRYVIIFNGEIYNYIEIKNELRQSGAVFQTDSDTEVILEAYKKWGESCLDYFNGMFAFALYDMDTNTLFCARDRYGEKPFLFAKGKDFFVFASEYKAILSLKEISLEYDTFRLLRFAHKPSFGLDGDRKTVFKDIQQLLPAEKLTLDVNTLNYRIKRYWDVYPKPEYASLSDKDAQELFRELLIDSVRIRMRSDVRVGSCLSGGLDSSALVGIARHLLGKSTEYHTFTGRFPGTYADEWGYAKQVVEYNKTISHVVEPTDERLLKDIEDFIWHNELPVGGTSQFAQWCVFKLAKNHGVTVLLDGQGADELLGGYEPIFAYYIQSLKEMGKNNILEREFLKINERYPLALQGRLHQVRDKMPFGLRRCFAYMTKKGSSLAFGVRKKWLSELFEKNQAIRVERFHALSSFLYNQSFSLFLTTLLRYGDRNSMAHSREVRLPFCDYRLPELIFSLPPEYIMGEIQTKRMLRKSMDGFLPNEIQTRWNKQGFNPPQDLWFQKGPLLDQITEIILSQGFKNHPVWEQKWWIQVLTRVRKGDLTVAGILWKPFIQENWQKYFIERIKSSERLSLAL